MCARWAYTIHLRAENKPVQLSRLAVNHIDKFTGERFSSAQKLEEQPLTLLPLFRRPSVCWAHRSVCKTAEPIEMDVV